MNGAEVIPWIDDTPRFRLLSFLRRQESTSPAEHWIPAFAGMTGRGAFSQIFQEIVLDV
jgi:hypothetical protein